MAKKKSSAKKGTEAPVAEPVAASADEYIALPADKNPGALLLAAHSDEMDTMRALCNAVQEEQVSKASDYGRTAKRNAKFLRSYSPAADERVYEAALHRLDGILTKIAGYPEGPRHFGKPAGFSSAGEAQQAISFLRDNQHPVIVLGSGEEDRITPYQFLGAIFDKHTSMNVDKLDEALRRLAPPEAGVTAAAAQAVQAPVESAPTVAVTVGAEPYKVKLDPEKAEDKPVIKALRHAWELLDTEQTMMESPYGERATDEYRDALEDMKATIARIAGDSGGMMAGMGWSEPEGFDSQRQARAELQYLMMDGNAPTAPKILVNKKADTRVTPMQILAHLEEHYGDRVPDMDKAQARLYAEIETLRQVAEGQRQG